MSSDIHCEYCGIHLTGMTIEGGGRSFCCEAHRNRYFARLQARAVRPDRWSFELPAHHPHTS
jgi:hypothetical protein